MLNVIQNDQGLFLNVDTSQTPAIPSMSAGAPASAGRAVLPTEKEMDGLRQAIESLGKNIQQTPPSLPSEGANVSGAVQTAPVQTALVNLQQILSPVSPGDNLESLMQKVRSFIENSGIYFEKKLESVVRSLQPGPPDGAPATMASQLADHPAVRALIDTDLKPNLLVLKQFLEAQTEKTQNPDRAMLETLRSVVDRTLTNIEQQQQAATERPASADVFQAFSHLLHLADPKQNARLKVYYAKKNKDEEAKPPRVSLLLEMDRLGTLRSDLWMVGKDLNITFFVKDADVKSTIEAVHHQIKTMLHDTFNTVAVSVVVSEKKIDAFDGEDLLPAVRRQLDVNA
ncbi:hypothetical protein [Desulfosarcina cetonica]|uniref:hypothetical protein n=1 Tax=Desulfosarcina cetonica TaxID=90730 RepID=UPI0012ED75C3|nr:hypothetical protein [Desulfosarcina cetonica]